jgi:hypothetical protein
LEAAKRKTFIVGSWHWRGLLAGCVHATLLARTAPKLTVVVVVVVTAVSVVVPVSETVVLMMAMEVGSQLAERHWRG